MDFQKILLELKEFNDERDWGQFHNIKNLASAISVEAAELQEIFLWKDKSELQETLESKRKDIEEEVADIFLFLTTFSYRANIDLESAVLKKMQKNREKYPVEKAKGTSKKYNEL
jgi:dCTP diphosphatase